MTEVIIVNSSPSIPDPSALVSKGHNNDGLLYRWKLGDCLASVACSYGRPSIDWKVLYALNSQLYSKRHNLILEGDLIKIPPEWIHQKAQWSFDATKVRHGNQDLHRESFIRQFYGNIQRYKGDSDDQND